MSESTALATYKSHYVAKKALFSFLGAAFRLYTPEGELAFFVKKTVEEAGTEFAFPSTSVYLESGAEVFQPPEGDSSAAAAALS